MQWLYIYTDTSNPSVGEINATDRRDIINRGVWKPLNKWRTLRVVVPQKASHGNRTPYSRCSLPPHVLGLLLNYPEAAQYWICHCEISVCLHWSSCWIILRARIKKKLDYIFHCRARKIFWNHLYLPTLSFLKVFFSFSSHLVRSVIKLWPPRSAGEWALFYRFYSNKLRINTDWNLAYEFNFYWMSREKHRQAVA